MVGGFFMRSLSVAVPILLGAGVGAAAIVTLPYPLYASLTDERRAGQHTGMFVVSLGLGRLAAPMIVGAAIDVSRRWLPETKGYPAMWLVAALFAAAGLLVLRSVDDPGDRA
jgi:prepilin signal peptidase PulO-like enzyme (type II secretory pathway)